MLNEVKHPLFKTLCLARGMNRMVHTSGGELPLQVHLGGESPRRGEVYLRPQWGGDKLQGLLKNPKTVVDELARRPFVAV